MMRTLILLVSLCLFQTKAKSQIKVPAPSPLATVTQKIGIADVNLSFSRPGVKGRKIFDENGIVPLDDFWRTGANGPTTLEVSMDFYINDEKLTKGKYVILSKPGNREWTFYFYKYSKGSWSKYVDLEPAVVSKVMPVNLSSKRENMLLYFDNLNMYTADLCLEWEYKKMQIPIRIPAHDQIVKSINKVMSGPSSFDYFNAATFYYYSKKDMKRALEYIRYATKGPNPRFFFYIRESTILAELGRYQEAIESAKKSIELAQKVGNNDAINLSNRNISEWEKFE